MRQQRTDRILLLTAMGGFLVMALSFPLMPLEALGILPGLLFWGGLAVGALLMVVLERRRRRFFAGYHVNRKRMQKPHSGLLTFGSNRAAAVADIGLAISAAATAGVLIITKAAGRLCYWSIAFLLTFLSFHCILNGRIYFHVKNQMKIRKALEKKANSRNEGEEGTWKERILSD